MKKVLNVKVLFLVGLFATLFVLSGCGLNQQSASESDPVPVDVNVTDPTLEDPIGEEDPLLDDLADEDEILDDAADPNQPADGGEGGEGSTGTDGQSAADDTTDPGTDNTASETPNPESPAVEPAATSDGQSTDPNAEQPDATSPTPVPPTAVPPTAVPDTNIDLEDTHIVLAGQTLFSIAQRYGLTVQELAIANNIINPNILAAGEELIIPVAGTVALPDTAAVHIVSYGETIYSIALRYGLTVEEIALHNELENINRIDIGQEIEIPVGDGK